MSSAVSRAPHPPGDVRALFGPGSPRVLPATAKPPADRVVYVLDAVPASATGKGAEARTVTVPTTAAAGRAVDREARLLVELRRRRLGAIEASIPRYVATRSWDGLPVLVASTVPGVPMSAAHRTWPPLARRPLVRRDFTAAADWLARLHDASALTPAPTTWPGEVLRLTGDRWPATGPARGARARLEQAAERLEGHPVEPTVVHGAFSCEHLLLEGHRVSGVTHWAAGEVEGSPLRDLARFALTYPLRPESPLRRGPSALAALAGNSWYADLVRSFLTAGLTRLGVPAQHWYDVALIGTAELALTEPDERTATAHLHALARAPRDGH